MNILFQDQTDPERRCRAVGEHGNYFQCLVYFWSGTNWNYVGKTEISKSLFSDAPVNDRIGFRVVR